MNSRSIKHKNFIIVFAIVLLLGAGAAFAWYIINSEAGVNGLEFGVDSAEGIVVKMKVENNGKSSGDKVLMEQINRDGKIIDIGLVKLTNIEEGMLAPGAFGEIHFYISTSSPYYNGFSIDIKPEYKFIDGMEDIKTVKNGVLTPVITEEELADIIDRHLLYFTERSVDVNTGRVTYSGRVEYDAATASFVNAEGTLTPNQEKEFVIYWCWPYEYTDYLAAKGLSSVGVTEDDIRNYDLEDTKMGNYIESISLNFTVTGIQNTQ